LVFTPAKYPYKDGVWRGPLIVVVDGDTWSAAEQFAAVLQDSHAAVIVGAPTGGAGCGHTDGGTPTTLAHSRGVLKLPDCARLRGDGDNEAAGVQPDLLVGHRRNDGVDRQARFLVEKLPEAVRFAIKLRKSDLASK
jgi:C-terminal processing protease CtpA/Prc